MFKWLLGFLLPFHAVAWVSEGSLDLARYSLCLLLGIQAFLGRNRGSWTPRFHEVALLLAGVWIFFLGGYTGDALAVSVSSVLIVSVVAVFLLRASGSVGTRLIQGFLVGSGINALAVIAQAAGYVVPGATVEFKGFDRFVGFGLNAPLTSFELAVATVLCFGIKRLIFRLPLQAVLIAGLLATGGRGGLLAVALAVVAILLASTKLRRRGVLLLALGAGGYLWLSGASLTIFGTLNRLTGTGESTGEFSSGRDDLAAASFEALWQKPFGGFGLDTFVELHGRTPHSALLSFGLMGGIFAFILLLLVIGRLAREAVLQRGSHRPTVGMVVVLLVWSLIEPYGPFVGFTGMLFLAYVWTPEQQPTENSDEASTDSALSPQSRVKVRA